ncbi:MAG: very short patch repair endonuclease [Verrucomicrobia bacterium]|nr:very short patch repair endonuclease [Verrucomicrobiota bacterium]
MADVFSRRKRSLVMSRIRGTGNKDTELRLMAVFRAHRITGWRRGATLRGEVGGGRREVGGGRLRTFRVRPDFVFSKLKAAVFVDGCFWHGCPRHATQPKTNAAFWREKIAANKARDRRVNRALRAMGWTVVRVWEHELRRRDEAKLVRRLRQALAT